MCHNIYIPQRRKEQVEKNLCNPCEIFIQNHLLLIKKEYMENSNLNKIKKLIVSRLKPLNPLKIILFGSYAYGNPNENSDIDLCVIQERVESKINEKRRIRQLLKDINISKDILVPSISEYDFYKSEYGSVYMDIEKNGIVLWQNS
jgi:uncharacterized protein